MHQHYTLSFVTYFSTRVRPGKNFEKADIIILYVAPQSAGRHDREIEGDSLALVALYVKKP